MAILSKTLIRERLALNVDDPKSVVISPLLEPDRAFDEDSVDLRLGTHFILPSNPPSPAVAPGLGGHTGTNRIHVPLGDFIVIPAHQTVLGMTLEFVKHPTGCLGSYPYQVLSRKDVRCYRDSPVDTPRVSGLFDT